MILFFGCWKEAGHYMRDPGGDMPRIQVGGMVTDRWSNVVPWGTRVDGCLAPRLPNGAERPNGVASFHVSIEVLPGGEENVWTAISWWDNSIDTRGNSSCTFLADHNGSASSLLAEARAAFPQIFERFKYEVVVP